LALATGIKHLESNASKSRMCVYVSSRQNDAEKAALEVRKNCQNTKEFVCFGPASGSSEYSRILTYHAAGEYARFFSEKGKDVLLIVDCVGDLFLAQHRIQGESELPVVRFFNKANVGTAA
jgi:F0F1-type ATP synthase alpha subunit